jgi:hypothetical protein
MYYELALCVNSTENKHSFSARSDEKIMSLKERIGHKFKLSLFGMTLRAAPDGRYLDKE